MKIHQSWDRSDKIAVVVLGMIAFLTRLIYLPIARLSLHSDDFLVGVFSLGILRGNFSLYYGDHTGTLSSYLITPLIALFGSSMPVLLLLPVLLSTALTITMYGIGRDLFGKIAGISAGAWMAIPSSTAFMWTMKLQPGFLEALLCSALSLWCMIRLCTYTETLSTKDKIWLMALTSIGASLAIWSGYVIITVILCTLLVPILYRTKLLSLPIQGYVIGILIPIIFFIAPLFYYVHMHPEANPLTYAFGPKPDGVHPRTALKNFIFILTPMFLGIERPSGRIQVDHITATLTYLATILSIIIPLFLLFIKRKITAAVPLLLIILPLSAFIFTSFGSMIKEVRYILPMYLSIPLLLGITIQFLYELKINTIIPVVSILLLSITNIVSSFGDVSFSQFNQKRDLTIAAEAIEQEHISYVYSSYWLAMGLMTESNGHIIPSTLVGATRVSYDKRNEADTLLAFGNATGFLFRSQGHSDQSFRTYIGSKNIQCETRTYEGFTFYLHCDPFPNMQELITVMPADSSE